MSEYTHLNYAPERRPQKLFTLRPPLKLRRNVIKTSIQDFPKVVGRILYFFDYDGMLHAYQLDLGTVLWKVSVAFRDEDIEGEEAVCLVDGEDIVAGTQYQLFHVARSTGESTALGLSDIGLRDGILSSGRLCATRLVNFGDLCIFCYDLHLRKTVWEHKLGGDGTMVKVGDRIVYDDNGYKICCRFLSDGSVAWETRLQKARQSALMYDGKSIIYGEKGGTIRFLDAQTGSERGALKLPDSSLVNLCFVDSELLGLLTQQHWHLIDPKEFKLIHSSNIQERFASKANPIAPSAITGSQSHVFFHNTLGRKLHALDRATMEIVWDYDLPRDTPLGIAPGVVGNLMLMVDAEGKLLIFEEAGAT